MWDSHMTEYYPSFKRIIIKLATTRMNLGHVTPSEICQSQLL
jgi:hypothetical protein